MTSAFSPAIEPVRSSWQTIGYRSLLVDISEFTIDSEPSEGSRKLWYRDKLLDNSFWPAEFRIKPSDNFFLDKYNLLAINHCCLSAPRPALPCIMSLAAIHSSAVILSLYSMETAKIRSTAG